jgi:hypothetical protein
MRATLPGAAVPVDPIAVERMCDRAIGAFYVVETDGAKQSHKDLPENRVVIHRHDQADVAPGT